MNFERNPLLVHVSAGDLSFESVQREIWPLFSRTLQREEIYLANHSLGRPLDKMADDVRFAVDAWYELMDDAWGPWWNILTTFRNETAKSIGLWRGDCVVPKSSAGQGLRAVLNAFPTNRKLNVVATRGEFDSLDVILKTYVQKGRIDVCWVQPTEAEHGIPKFSASEIMAALKPGVDLVVMPAVFFATGQVLVGAEDVVPRAHSVGAKVLLDVYHAQGVLPLQMEDHDFDFMVGGSYKYIRGGPGAGWLAIHPNVVDEMTTLDTGWFAQREPFAFERHEQVILAKNGDRWMESTMPILPYAQALAGLELLNAIGLSRLRSYTLNLLQTWREEMTRAGISVFEPSQPSAWGGYGLWPREDFTDVVNQLSEFGINVDARSGNVRFGPDLLTSPAELREAAERIATVYG